MEINREKARKFYNDIIYQYSNEDRDFFFGNEGDFLESFRNAEYPEGVDQYEVEFLNSFKIIFSKELFITLFTGSKEITFDRSKRERYNEDGYLYMELVESPIVKIESKEKSRLIPITKSENQKEVEECLFINEEALEDIYYPKEVLPFFVSQLKKRLITDFKFSINTDTPISFYSLFEPIKYILKVNKQNERLLTKLLYKLSIHLGVVEIKKLEIRKISISQEIQSLLDNGSFLLSDEESYNLNSLTYYLSAISNLHIIYQFLDLYNVLESFFYKYFYKHVKGLKNSGSPKKLINSVKKYMNERGMLKLLIEDTSKQFPDIHSGLKTIKHFRQFCKNVLGKDNNLDAKKWNYNETDKFSNSVSDFIYSIRNQVVHSKPELGKNIKDLTEDEQEVLAKINKILCLIVKEILEKNITW